MYFFLSAIVFFSSVWLFFYGLGRIQTGSSSKENQEDTNLTFPWGPRPHRKQPPVDHFSALRLTPSTPNTFQHTYLFPFPTTTGGFLTSAIFFEKDRKLRGDAFQSPVLSFTRSIQGTGIQHGGMALGERKHPPMCFILQQ